MQLPFVAAHGTNLVWIGSSFEFHLGRWAPKAVSLKFHEIDG